MIALEEIWGLVESINEQAHQDSWDTWIEADRLEESDDEDDWEEAEDVRELASRQQAESFQDQYFELDKEYQDAIRHWLEHDSNFRDQFQTWFGEEEFEREFNVQDNSEGGHLD